MFERDEYDDCGVTTEPQRYDKTLTIGLDDSTFYGLRNIANVKKMGINELAAKALKLYVATEELKGR